MYKVRERENIEEKIWTEHGALSTTAIRRTGRFGASTAISNERCRPTRQIDRFKADYVLANNQMTQQKKTVRIWSLDRYRVYCRYLLYSKNMYPIGSMHIASKPYLSRRLSSQSAQGARTCTLIALHNRSGYLYIIIISFVCRGRDQGSYQCRPPAPGPADTDSWNVLLNRVLPYSVLVKLGGAKIGKQCG